MLDRKVGYISLVALFLGVFHHTVYADEMFGTGGYAREFKKMEMMKMLDGDGNHMVNAAELESYYSDIFSKLDKDNDGTLSLKEWVGVKGKTKIDVATGGYSRQLRSTKVMDAMDSDGDHKVTKDEFVSFHQKIFEAMDKDGDQQLDPQEWLAKRIG